MGLCAHTAFVLVVRGLFIAICSSLLPHYPRACYRVLWDFVSWNAMFAVVRPSATARNAQGGCESIELEVSFG